MKGHPLDIELLDHIEGSPENRELIEEHVIRCELCRIKCARLREQHNDGE